MMQWHGDPDNDAYLFTGLVYHGSVRPSAAGFWLAQVSKHGQPVIRRVCETQNDAVRWCEHEIISRMRNGAAGAWTRTNRLLYGDTMPRLLEQNGSRLRSADVQMPPAQGTLKQAQRVQQPAGEPLGVDVEQDG